MPNPLQITDPDSDNPLAQAPSWADAYGSVTGSTQNPISDLDRWLAAQRAKSAQMGLWNDRTGLPTGKGLVSAAQQTGNALLMGTTAPGFRAPIRPASESVPRAMDATFTYGKDLGPAAVPIDSLSGGTSSSKVEASRVADLKDKISSPDGYISRLIVDSDGNVVEGQHRLEALRQLGAQTVPVHVIHDLASGVDTDGLNVAVRDAQTMHGDQRTQLIGHVLDALHEEGGSVANVQANYDPPRGYEKAWNAALSFLGVKQ